jgi:DNA-binding HxlR family transcriptional regulator
MRILRALSTGPKTVRELCRCLFPSSHMTVERHVGWLMDKGLVEELKVSSTGKPRVLKLTERGARVASMVAQILAEIEG